MHLHPEISFARVQGQFVFLDLARDRYFSLSGNLARAFESLLEGSADRDALDDLRKKGIVVEGESSPVPALAPDIPRSSILDRSRSTSVSLTRVVALAWSFSVMRSKLKRSGIAGPARALAMVRQAATTSHDEGVLIAGARAYDQLCLIRGAHNLCLPHSLALATMLVRQGCAAEVVLGVQLGPFAAHCWVECQGELVNDRFDRVRSYTPIRRL